MDTLNTLETDHKLAVFQLQKNYFYEGHTLSYESRKEALTILKKGIKSYEDKLLKALAQDMGKNPFEAFAAEIGILYEEIDLHLKKLKTWMKPKRVGINQLVHFYSKGSIQSQPFGTCLIIAPWNYPVQLSISPLIGAISAGNTAVLKPSEYTPHVAQTIHEMIHEIFPEHLVKVYLGGPEVSQELLEFHWDKIFFTGSPRVGSLIMKKAAEKLIPITLELGGKSPCVVSDKAHIEVAARRIIWGKMLNAGQTCIAPDHVYVHHNVKEKLIAAMKKEIDNFYGNNPLDNKDLANIVNSHHFHRVFNYLESGKVIHGGAAHAETRKISPTLLEVIDLDSPIMQEEIFGPLLPILVFDDLKTFVFSQKRLPKPLAYYFFSEDQEEQKFVLEQSSSGSMGINEVVMQAASNTLPFGGVGRSGMGNYHGAASFDCFSHKRSILKKSSWPDIPLRYPPYGDKLKWVKMIFK